ncbi:MAG: class IV adenylate cyclase [Cytophagaceae bacterium]|nr:class IV adenylate cyclase [Gemmatimonadaceae bacterium]
MREVEVKGVVPDLAAARAALLRAGARLLLEGTMVDRRYDTPGFDLRTRDEVLRIRITRGNGGVEARVDFKGPATYPDGFKVREEVGTTIGDVDVLEQILASLGYRISREIEREIEVFELSGATARFETYPRMDVLVEVEGDPEGIERAIDATGITRSAFTTERLADFVGRYEARTGQRAALCARELHGDFTYRIDDA